MGPSTTRLASFIGAFRRGPEDDSAERLQASLDHPVRFRESAGLVLACDAWQELSRESHAPIACGLSGRVLGSEGVDRAASLSSVVRPLLERGAAALRDREGPFLAAIAAHASGPATRIRDKFGAKQIFYTVLDDRLWFSDHILPLVRLLPNADVRTGGLLEWLHFGTPLPPKTFFAQIHSLPPGHLLTWTADGGGPEVARYFDVCDEVSAEIHRALSRRSIAALERELEDHLHRAVQACMQGASRVTVLLSGGVDSSVLTAIAAQHAEVDAITLDVVGEDAASELPYADAVARHVGADLHPCRFGAEEFRGGVVETVYRTGSPTIVESAVALLHAASSGALPESQMILDGEGADALYAGSTSLFKFSMMSYLASAVGHVSDRRVQRATSALRRRFEQLGLATSTPIDSRGLD
jgi:asparagine synthetase B (glutamine-hydrolysing)